VDRAITTSFMPRSQTEFFQRDVASPSILSNPIGSFDLLRAENRTVQTADSSRPIPIGEGVSGSSRIYIAGKAARRENPPSVNRRGLREHDAGAQPLSTASPNS
jgi:hypothetical protein